jgi:hypothetical protein
MGGFPMFDSTSCANPTRRLSRNFAALALAVAVASGCAMTQNVRQIDKLEAVSENPRILLMTPDIKYYLITTGGVAEPHADWTEAARSNFAVALARFADARSIDVVTGSDEINLSDQEISYRKLHAAVGYTIMNNYFGMQTLPSKNREFDWSLGPDIRSIGEQYDADYAFFVFYRDYQASGGRIFFSVLAAVAGVGVSTGWEGGFASMVDLKTGDIVWFNMVLAGSGELRNADGAAATVNKLFKDMPAG